MTTKIRRKEAEVNLPSPWKAFLYTKTGKLFYWNPDTDESVYERPQNPETSKIPGSSSIPTKSQKSKRKRDESPDPQTKRIKVIKSSIPFINTRKRKNISYKECVILDTNVFINHPNILEHLCEKNILTVVPYTVISELNGLKSRPDLMKVVNNVCRRIEKLKNEECAYLELESQAERMFCLDNYVENPEDNDDKILKCGLRVKAELSSKESDVNIEKVTLITDDINLRVKAQANSMKTSSMDDYLKTINLNNSRREMSLECDEPAQISRVPIIDSDSDEDRREPSREPTPVKIDPSRFSFSQLLKLDMETETCSNKQEVDDDDDIPCVPVIRRSKSPTLSNDQPTRYKYRDNPKLASFLTNGVYKPDYYSNNRTCTINKQQTHQPPVEQRRPIARMPLDDDLNEHQESMDCS